jgi:hypothetical protein
VLTAAHCLWWSTEHLDPSTLEFRLLAAPQNRFVPTGQQTLETRDEDLISDSTDYVVLNVDTSVVPFMLTKEQFRTSLPVNERLIIPGVNLFDYNLLRDRQRGDWVGSVQVDRYRSCFRYPPIAFKPPIPPNCVATGCQTLPGMSGAPIIGFDAKARVPYVGGIHLRPGELTFEQSSHKSRECGDIPGLNVGIQLPDVVVGSLKEKQ